MKRVVMLAVWGRSGRYYTQGPTSQIIAPIMKIKKRRHPKELRPLLSSHKELLVEVKTHLGDGGAGVMFETQIRQPVSLSRLHVSHS